MLNPGVLCHCCEGNISGTRYKCTVCPDYDLCSGCQSTGLHEEHRLRSIPIPGPPAPKRKRHEVEDSGMLRPGVLCHCCEGNISGNRYKCTVCPDYDLCSGCQSTGLHEEHRLRSIPIPGSQSQTVLADGGSVASACEYTEVNTQQLPAGPSEPKRRKHDVEVPLPEKTVASTQGSSVKILVASKVELVEWLRSDLYILQHAHSGGIIDERVYNQLMNIVQPEEACTKLIDIITKRGEGPSSQFLKLLKKQQILDTYPQLKEWNPSFQQPEPGDNMHTNWLNSAPCQTGQCGIAGPHRPMKIRLSVEEEEDRQKLPKASVSDFVDKQRVPLTQRVKMVDPILDLLLAERSITQEGYENVRSKSTTQAQMRELYKLLNSRKAKEIFYKGLEENEEYLLEDLK